MTLRKIPLLLFLIFVVIGSAKSQLIGFRLGVNSNVFVNELGTSDVPHPDALAATPAINTQKFVPQPTIGVEAEILFQVSPMSHFGVELEYSKLKGYNNTPPVYNYYLTPYFNQFQDSYIDAPVAFNTTLFNVAVNWKYFFFKTSPLKPFVKLTGVVAFVGTDFQYREFPVEEYVNQLELPGFDPNTNAMIDYAVELPNTILYARGTSNTDQEKWPAFHLGGGVGFDYSINERWSFQVDGTATVINSGIINGVPNFTYEKVDEKDMLRYNNRSSLTLQISAGLVYSISVGESGKGPRGETDPNLPFYRKK
ncbi:hypothetical protein [uncultured Draconibacterium sp.]|uniref:hypothetical protein n=1 Tax=uncultured Draconibacterium sp. TaxID=1573823 RepID=UPI0032175B04